MALVNMTLQGKGGVGKSYVAANLAQFYLRQGKAPLCVDTDPVNKTFAGYKAFGVESLRLGETADEVNPRNFDALIELIATTPEDAVVVVDNGASTFLPLVAYMVENDVPAFLKAEGHTIRLHSVVTGGQALEDTVLGLEHILSYFPDAEIVVWLNEFFGRIEKGGKTFEKFQIYKECADRLTALVHLPQLRKETFGADIEAMLKARLTYDEAVGSPEFGLMARQRLKSVSRTVFSEMERALL